jgi:hypothetical protein
MSCIGHMRSGYGCQTSHRACLLTYSRYIGTIATTLGDDGEEKRTEAEKKGKGDETQKSAATDIASRAN